MPARLISDPVLRAVTCSSHFSPPCALAIIPDGRYGAYKAGTVSMRRNDWYSKDYLASDSWKQTKGTFQKRKRNQKCWVCKLPGKFHVHHTNYDHLGKEHKSELVTLCPICHAAIHKSPHALGSKEFRSLHYKLAKEWNRHANRKHVWKLRWNDRLQYAIHLIHFHKLDPDNLFFC